MPKNTSPESAGSESARDPKPPHQQWIPVTAEDVAGKQRRKILVITAAVMVLLASGWYVYSRSVSPLEGQQALDAGTRLVKSANYEQAILNLNRALDMSPNSVDAHLMRASAFSAEGNFAAAIKDYSKVVELSPRDAAALVERGLLYLDKKDYAHAIADASSAVGLNPKLARAYNLRATAVRDSGNPAKSIDDFSHAVELDGNLDNLFQRAATYQLLNDHRAAIADFDRALEIAPDQPHIYYARARSRSAIGDSKGAASDFQTARKLDNF